MGVTMGISLYTTRLLLSTLGVTDYGIFNLVAGVIAMLSFLNTAMATSTQRFLSYQIGKKDIAMQRNIFFNSLVLHLAIGIIMVLTLEIIGTFLFKSVLNIPVSRVEAASAIYHFMSLTVFFTVVSVPFSASLNANENMLWISIVLITETVLKLVIAVILVDVASDKLILYGILTACISVISFLLYAGYCVKNYTECSIRNRGTFNKSQLLELTSFAGWNLFGSLCAISRTQGVAILLNVFLGASINASYGIANQVAAQLSFFSLTLLRVVNPQIMKSEGSGNRERMLMLSMAGSKFGFFLLALIAVPCIFEMPEILSVWLTKVPENAVSFCNLIVIATLVNQLTVGLQSAIQATGNIKAYQTVVGSVLLLNIPMAFLVLHFGLPVYWVMLSFGIVEFTACIFRLYFLRKLAGMSIKKYVRKVFVKEVLPLCVMIGSAYLSSHYLNVPYRFILTIGISAALSSIAIVLAGLSKEEKDFFQKAKNNLLSKFLPNRGQLKSI